MPVTLLLHGKLGPKVRYEPVGPWLVPWELADGTCEDDYRALRQGAALIDYSTQAWIEVGGRDRTGFLQRLLTNDIAALQPGAGCRAALLAPNAKLIATMLVLADTGALWLACDLPQAAALAGALERYHFSEEVTITAHERRFGVLAVEGPRAIDAVSRLSGGPLALPRTGDHRMAMLGDGPVRVIRHGVAGGEGVWLAIEAERFETMWRWLADQAPAGLRPTGWSALNTARIEAGEPWFGVDMDETNLLPETGLDRVMASDRKGCYVGQEVVARMGTYGSPSQRLMGLVLERGNAAGPGARLTRDGEDVGRITSAGVSPSLGAIALAYLKRGAYEAGTTVEVTNGRGVSKGVVAELPLTPASTARTRPGGSAT